MVALLERYLLPDPPDSSILMHPRSLRGVGSPHRIHGLEKFFMRQSPGKSLSRCKDKDRHAADASLKSVGACAVYFCPVTSCMQDLEYLVASHPHFFPYLRKHLRITDVPCLGMQRAEMGGAEEISCAFGQEDRGVLACTGASIPFSWTAIQGNCGAFSANG